VEITFGSRVRRSTLREPFAPRPSRRDNGRVIVNVFYKASRIKQDLKDGRAVRIEAVAAHRLVV
jgi:hypothetical protein